MTVKCNVHTHTSFCDGKNTAEEMVLAAIECGCSCLGFSGHSYIKEDSAADWVMSCEDQKKYIQEIERLKVEYDDRIEILLGIEQDYFSEPLENVYDYIIGSVHATVKNGVRIDVDNTPDALLMGIDEFYSGDAMELVRDYYALMANVVDKTGCDIIGHFDLVTKFNNKYPFIDTHSMDYRNIALESLDALIEKNKIFEINTGAISRGWHTLPYPEDFLLKRLAEKKADVMITSDSHACETIMFGFDKAIEYAKYCGIRSVCVYEDKKIKKIAI